MSPLITTVLPTFRRPAYLRRAIGSVLAQTYRDLQVCVYDNASGDDTEAVVADIMRGDRRVRYHRHPQNIGAFANFQFGLTRIDTPYFSFLSDDDMLLPDFYQRAVAALDERPDCAFVCTQVVRLGPHRTLVSRRPDYFPAGAYTTPAGFSQLLERGVPVWTGILFRSSLRDTIGLLDARVGFASDVDFTLRAACRFPFLVIDVPGAIYLMDAPSAYREGGRHLLEERQAIWNWCHSIKNEYGLPRETAEQACILVRRRHARQLHHAATRWAVDGRIAEAESAYPVVEELAPGEAARLKRKVAILKYAPPLRWVGRLRETMRATPFYQRLRRRKRAAAYGDFMRYEQYEGTPGGL